ncbi:MAG TPA: response regulator [Vicinamibacterales bacterium]|nr:response regulator [Vicinamibacterales bacterium]
MPRRPPRVAVADPFPDERELLDQVFSSAGYEVDVLLPQPLDVAIARVLSTQPDLVVTRIRPERFGIELTAAVKADHRTRGIPVIVLTTEVRPELRDLARQAGADEVLLLPSLPDEMVRIAEALLHKRRRS